MVEIEFTLEANIDIIDIYNSFSQAPQTLAKIGKGLERGLRTLRLFPQAGVVELINPGSKYTYRTLVITSRYKLIYVIENEIVYITAVWDCRQDPNKLSDRLK